MKFKAIILAILIALGILISLYVYWGIVAHHLLSAGLFCGALLIDAMYSAKIMTEFRQLKKKVQARDGIRNILFPLIKDKTHATVLAENLVLHQTTLSQWPEIPRGEAERIEQILSKIGVRARTTQS